MPEESPMISRTSASGSRSTDPCVNLEGRDGEQIQVLVRSPEPDDQALGLVLDCMARAAADHSPWQQRLDGPGGCQPSPVPRGIHLRHHDTLLKKNLPNMSIMVACDPSAPSAVWGWCAYSPEVLHYVYVKSAFRRMGIGGAMIRDLLDNGIFSDAGEICCSHRTAGLFRAWPNTRWLWNPYKILGL